MSRILIIDDSETVCTKLRRNLIMLQHTVVVKYNSLDGIRDLDAIFPDLVVLNVSNNEMDVYDIIEVIRRLSLSIPILILADEKSDEEYIKGINHGADDVILKTDFEYIIGRIEACLTLKDL